LADTLPEAFGAASRALT